MEHCKPQEVHDNCLLQKAGQQRTTFENLLVSTEILGKYALEPFGLLSFCLFFATKSPL